MSDIISQAATISGLDGKEVGKDTDKNINRNINKNVDKGISIGTNENYLENGKVDDNYAKRVLDEVLDIALKEGASDIHIEPFEEYLIIRIRVDGELKELSKFQISLYPSLSTLIKLRALMDITEKRLPQDGRIHMKYVDNLVDIRVSTILTIYGEKIVLRVLNLGSFLRSKKEIGFSEKAISIVDRIVNRKSGILLVTGPTGSGKTTTVYSILNGLREKSKNIMTIENPVEYKIEGINQIEVNNRIGLTFDVGLRSILRQDPDIIMIGEIRDLETAKIAVRAAITGHLVISTLHTNDAVSSITRLIDMEIKPYLINASVVGVISQRLVKKLCQDCSHDITIQDNQGQNISTRVATGCKKCGGQGYIGRTAIYEILEIDDDVRNCIKDNMDSKCIRDTAIKNGMITFEDSCKDIIKRKITTVEECTMVNSFI